MIFYLQQIMKFFHDLSPQAAAAWVGSVFLLGNTALTLYITSKVSKNTLASAEAIKSRELDHSARVALAKARIEWVNELRNDTAELNGELYQLGIIRTRREELGEEFYSKELEVLKEISRAKAKILMRINPKTSDEDEKALEKLINKAQPKEKPEAAKHRKELRKLTRQVLNAEWNKAKSEILSSQESTGT